MKTVLSVDVAKNKSMILLMNNDGEILIDTKEIKHNLEEFEGYVKGLNKNIVGKVFFDHPNGGTIFKNIKGYASEGTIKSMKDGTIYNFKTQEEK